MDILIVEDEYLAVQKLTKLLNTSPTPTTIIGVTDGIESTVEWLSAHPSPDLILMDIELADGQSFEIFNQVSIRCPVIFTTSYDESAIKSFRGSSLDYLLKPIKRDELEQALSKFDQVTKGPVSASDIDDFLIDLKKQTQQREFKHQFLVRYEQQLIPVYTSEIAYFFTTEDNTFIRTTQKSSYIVDYSLNDVERLVDPTRFFRINNQLLIEAKAVVQTHYSLNGQLKVALSPDPGYDVLINRERTNEFNQWLIR